MKRVYFAADGVTVANVAVIADGAEPAPGTMDVPDGTYVGPGMLYQDGAFVPAPIVVTGDMVDAERDRRIEAGMVYNGQRFQTRAQDRENMVGACTWALRAIMLGAEPGDYYWHGGESPFVWIAEDNSTQQFDAQTLFDLGQRMAAHKQAHIFAARALKDLDPIPPDYTADNYWPASA